MSVSLIKTDISGIAILKNIFVKIEFYHFTLPLKMEIHFQQMCQTPAVFPKIFFCGARFSDISAWIIYGEGVLNGGRRKSAYFVNFSCSIIQSFGRYIWWCFKVLRTDIYL